MIDLRYLFRNLRRSPASAWAAIVTLALTLGAGAAIFAVVHAVLLTPPPFTDPDALVIIGETRLDQPTAAPRAVSYGTFQAWRDRAAGMGVVEAVDGTNVTLTGLGAAERVSANDVTPGFLTLLGVTPAVGRAFVAGDPGRAVVVISDRFWRGKLGSDPGAIGRQVVLGGQAHTIVGILPAAFVFELNPADLWRPIPISPAAGYRVMVFARLAPHVSSAALPSALDGLARADSPRMRVLAIPVAQAISRDASRMLRVLAGAAGLAVLIAFTNFAGLLVVRSIERQRELAVRAALGATRRQIGTQLLLEAQALVAMGTLGGVALAVWITPGVARLVLEQFGGVAHREVAVSWPLVAVLAAGASVCAALCALVPAYFVSRRNFLDVLRRGATPPPRELAVRRAFVSAEIAVAFVLLACVTMVGGNLRHLRLAGPGFDPRGVLALQVSLPSGSYNLDRVISFYSALQSALSDRVGPGAVAFADEIPLAGGVGRSLIALRPGEPGRESVVRDVSASYFDVMGIPVVNGRSFEPRDNASAPPAVLISESLAHSLFASGLPIGRDIWLPSEGRTAEVIGVVADIKHRALDEPILPTVYRSAFQFPSRSSIVVIRTTRPDADVIAAVREEVGRLDGNLPVYAIRSMEDVVAASPGMPARRGVAAVLTAFSSLALVLGAIGLFGVIAHDIASRRQELALRIALGANSVRIARATLRPGAVMVGSGLVAGGLLSNWAAGALRAAGFAAGGLDLLSIGIPVAILVVTAAAAMLPAARRAAQTDPLIALRGE